MIKITIFIVSGVSEVCLEFERTVELMVCISFQLGSLLQANERLKCKVQIIPCPSQVPDSIDPSETAAHH